MVVNRKRDHLVHINISNREVLHPRYVNQALKIMQTLNTP